MRRLAVLVALLATCGEAAAHGSAKGLGSFFGGVVHPLLEPTHLISLVALGLVIGQRSLEETDPAALCFALGSAAGLALAGFGWTPDAELPLLATAALAGLAVALSARLPRLVCGVGAAILGAGIGLGSRSEASASTGALVATLLGAGVGASVWMLNVAVLVNHLKRPWLLIGVRVVGSWAAASSVLVLALWVSGRHEQVASTRGLPQSDAVFRLDTRR